jgi:hypothetical protein
MIPEVSDTTTVGSKRKPVSDIGDDEEVVSEHVLAKRRLLGFTFFASALLVRE